MRYCYEVTVFTVYPTAVRSSRLFELAQFTSKRPQKLDYYLKSTHYKHQMHISSENVLAYVEGRDPILKIKYGVCIVIIILALCAQPSAFNEINEVAKGKQAA